MPRPAPSISCSRSSASAGKCSTAATRSSHRRARTACSAAAGFRAGSWDERTAPMMNYRIDYSNPTDLERVAIHEAAHATVWTLSPLLPPVRMVELEVSDDRGLLGGACHSERISSAPADERL